MNIERLTEIAEWLETGGGRYFDIARFDMSSFGDLVDDEQGCGTACCIAGAAAILYAGVTPSDVCGGVNSIAECELDLTRSQGDDLFWIDNFDIDFGEITPAWAARTIRHLIATGTVDWNATREAP